MHSQVSYAIVLSVAVSGVVVALAQAPPQTPGSAVPGVPAPARPAARGATAPTTGTGIVRGRVVSDTGAPLPRVQIRLRPPVPREPLLTATDEQGRFEFIDVPAAQYSASAALSGYVAMQYGQRSPGEPARQIRVADGEMADRIDFTLPRGGAIIVQVSDEFGDPLAGFRAQVERYTYVNGQRRLTPAAGPLGSIAETDDRGLVRMFGLPPGEYVVSAALGILASVRPEGRSSVRSYMQTYYPDVYTPEQAQLVTLGLRQEITIPIRMTAIRIPKVSGVLRKANGEPAGQMNPMLGGRGTLTAPDGSFTFTSVAPGNYVLELAPAPAGSVNAGNTDVLRMPIVVGDGDVTGITAVMTKGGTAQGRVTFETGTAPSGLRPAALQVMATEPAASIPSALRAPLNDDWSFTGQALIGMRVFRLRQAPEGVFLKAVMLDGRDVTDAPLDFNNGKDIRDLEIVLTQKAAIVSGTVSDPQGAPATTYAVAVFPADRDQWTSYSRFIAAGRPDQQGAFRVAGLPAGRYLAAAVDYLEAGEERDPQLLERLSRSATAFTLTEGEARNLTLRVQGR